MVALLKECSASQTQRSAPTFGLDEETSLDRRISLGDVVGRFKSLTTRRYLEGVRQSNWRGFEDRLWQRNYYEHVIRDEIDYQAIYDYIIVNPQNWEKDVEFTS